MTLKVTVREEVKYPMDGRWRQLRSWEMSGEWSGDLFTAGQSEVARRAEEMCDKLDSRDPEFAPYPSYDGGFAQGFRVNYSYEIVCIDGRI